MISSFVKLLRIYSIKKNCFIRCLIVPFVVLDKVKEVHNAFLQAQRVVVVLRHLEGHEFGNFCKTKGKGIEADRNVLLSLSLWHFLSAGHEQQTLSVMTRKNRSSTCVRM